LAVAGSLTLSLGLGLKACPLCFYQRAFALSLVAVLAMGLIAGAHRDGLLAVLSLPLAIGGLGVAAFHVSLEFRGILECPSGLLGLGSAPQQSLAIFAIVFALLLMAVLRGGTSGAGRLGLPTGLVLGVVLAVSSCIANPPPKAPTEPYPNAPDICRLPFRG
jgi:disulfide bond formation protein DsbB